MLGLFSAEDKALEKARAKHRRTVELAVLRSSRKAR